MAKRERRGKRRRELYASMPSAISDPVTGESFFKDADNSEEARARRLRHQEAMDALDRCDEDEYDRIMATLF